MKKGCWAAVCDMKGYERHAVAEGMDPDTEIELTLEQARDLGLLEEE